MHDRGRRTAPGLRKAAGLRAILALICAACVLLPVTQSAEALKLPEDGFAPGWTKSGPRLKFNDKNLFDYIDGGAELFLEFGFKELLVQRYTQGGAELTLEVYRMKNPTAALGIYLARTDAESPVSGIKARSTGGSQQVTAVKGSVFVQVNNFDGGAEALPAMAELVNLSFRRVARGRPVTVLENLPRKNLVPGSEALVRGPFGLQPIFTFGSGDVLLLGGKVFAAVGEYYEGAPGPDAPRYTRIAILYPDRNAAERAYSNLVANLDPYLTVLAKAPSRAGGRTSGGPGSAAAGFTFRDFQGKFGSVVRQGRKMDISVNLSKEP